MVDGAVDTIDEAVAAIQRVLDGVTTVGLFGGAKVVWLREASFFSEAVPGKFESVKEAVARLTEEIKRGLLPGQRLLITAPKVHRGYGFYKACMAAGAVVEYDLSDKPREMMEQAQATVRELLAAEQIKASAATMQLLVKKAGYDTRLLVQEVAKLATYLGDRREVTEEDVRLMVSPSRESAAWDLAEVLSQRDLAACLRLFRQLMFQKEKPFVLLMGIEGRIRDMLALRELMEAGHLRLAQSGGGFANVVLSQQRGGARRRPRPDRPPAQGPSLSPARVDEGGGEFPHAGTAALVPAWPCKPTRASPRAGCRMNCCWSVCWWI